MKLRYNAERRRLPLSRPESFCGTLIVYENTFGYIKEKRSRKGKKPKERSMMTTNASACHVVFLLKRGRLRVLAHLNSLLDSFVALNRAMAYLHREGVIQNVEFDEALILRNPIFAPFVGASIRRTYLTLKLLGCEPKVVSCLPSFQFTQYTKEGDISRMRMRDVRDTDIGVYLDLDRKPHIREANERRTFECANTKEFVEDGFLEVYRGIPMLEMHKGSKRRAGMFAVNIRPNGIGPDILIGNARARPNVHAEIRDCSDGEYIRVYSEEVDGALDGLTIKRVEDTVMDIAAFMAMNGHSEL